VRLELQRAPVAVSVGADADVDGRKDAESEDGSEDGKVHDVVLLRRAQPCAALIPIRWGCRWCVFSAGGDEILTQPSRSLANLSGPVEVARPCLAASNLRVHRSYYG